jgi:NADH dehydrogenase FAD-containing subunit
MGGTCPGLKSLSDAIRIRRNVLRAFEQAEMEFDLEKRRKLMTIVVVGGGPTGVELAGAFAELVRHVLLRDFRRIDPAIARIILIEAADRVLGMFDAAAGQGPQATRSPWAWKSGHRARSRIWGLASSPREASASRRKTSFGARE